MPERRDLWTLATCLTLVGAAVAVGIYLNHTGHDVHTASPPIYAVWRPHASLASAAAIAIALAVIIYGPAVAQRLRWSVLLGSAYLAALAWTMSLALIDGWKVGFADRLTTDSEYLHEVPKITDAGAMLRGFTGRILDYQPDSYVTHVAGHPPGITLLFVAMDRVGLGGGAFASAACVLVGAVAAVCVPVTVKLLGSPAHARAIVPFAVLLPGAVWIGASADGLFAGVAALGIMLLAVRRWPAALAAGIVLGGCLFLSYGLVLLAIPAIAVIALGRSWRLLPATAIGAAAVVTGFAIAGFWWPDGYRLVVERYYQGIAAERAYSYWVWADLACLVLSAGPALIAATARAASHIVPPRTRTWRGQEAVIWLPLAAALAIIAADLSGMSKAEVERIWLPFEVWLLPAVALLPARSHRFWLTVQAATALAVNHLLFTIW